MYRLWLQVLLKVRLGTSLAWYGSQLCGEETFPVYYMWLNAIQEKFKFSHGWPMVFQGNRALSLYSGQFTLSTQLIKPIYDAL